MMLFDERDLRVFDSPDSRDYFKEILQTYYNQNYRATIVLLYSFVIYDLFIKLKEMSNEGDKKASKALNEINTMISNDERYSTIENKIVDFFLKNNALYFDKFKEDIKYLKECRNKCAHLKVDDDSLYIPTDYQVRMLICSMYDHIFSVRAPFIMDLFTIAEKDVEKYSDQMYCIPSQKLDESIVNHISNQYLKRMTYDSLKKSFRTFTKLLLVSEDKDALNNVYGLFAFEYSMVNYILKSEYSQILDEETVKNVFRKIDLEELKTSNDRVKALISLMLNFTKICELVSENKEVYCYLRDRVLGKVTGLKYYRLFYPHEQTTVYGYFKEHKSLGDPRFTSMIYNAVKEATDFNIADYLIFMVNNIPIFSGFYASDAFTDFFIEHIKELKVADIESIMSVYNKNNQCTGRDRYSSDIEKVKKCLMEIGVSAEQAREIVSKA